MNRLRKSGLSPVPEWVMGFRVRTIGALWLVMLVSALGAPGDPGEAAIRFLEKTRSREINLEPGRDTALSPQTSAAKSHEIARRLERLAGDLGDDPLEAGAVKLDGDMAGVLIRKNDDFDPDSLRVFAIALLKRGDTWMPAPVPASFENTGIGYSPDVRQRAAALQDWMLREQVFDLAKLREQATDNLRRNIEKSLSADTLRKLDSNQVAKRFLDACACRNLPEILGLLGGLSADPPDDWAARLKSATAAVRAAEPKRPWHLLVSNNVLRVPVHQEEDAGQVLISMACLDAFGGGNRPFTPRVELLHLEITKSVDGLWRVDLPSRFFQESSENDLPQDDSLDADLLAAFPERLAATFPLEPQPSAREACLKMLAALRSGNLPALVRLIQPADDAVETCIMAARALRELCEPRDIRLLVPLAFRVSDDQAASLCLMFSANNPESRERRVFHFEKTTQGWLCTHRPKPGRQDADDYWADAKCADWKDRLFAECVEIAEVPQTGAPSEAEARGVVESWLTATAAGDVVEALRLTARLYRDKSKTTVLQNLGYEISGSRKNDAPPAIIGVQRGRFWTVVGVRRVAGGKPAHPLYPVVNTKQGPRILIEIDLFASDSRTRDFLNRTALERLSLEPEAAAELKELLQKHQAGITESAAP